MSARIAKGSAARPRPKSVPARGRKPKRKSALAGLPAGAGWLRRAGAWLLLGMVGALAAAAAYAWQLPRLAGAAVGDAVGEAGFTMKRVEIKGADRVPELAVYNIAFDQDSMAMPRIDLGGTRARLLQFGWIKDATVSRRLPDTLVIDIVERRPAAIWQHDRRLSLIDSEGVVLEPVRLDAMPDLPLVIGPAANLHVAALETLLESAPHLRENLAGATWIGARRWDIRFQSGEVLALPEGEEAARRAIAGFARMDQQTRLLGRGFVRFDMRIPGRFIVRVSREPGGRVPDLAPVDPGERPADLSRTI